MFLVCGEALYDLFLTDETSPTQLQFDARAGGSPFNVAIGIARQGGTAALLTGISDDLLGNRLVSALECEQVDTRYLVRSGRRTTLSLVDLTQAGEPAYAFYGLGSADCSLTPEDLPSLGPEITGLHIGSYSIAVEPVASTFANFVLSKHHLFVSLDPNIRPTVEPDMARWRSAVDRLLPCVDLIKVSSEDLALLHPEESHAHIAERWLAAGVSAVAITTGADDVTCYRPNGRITVRPPTVDVVDTVGAGDGFQAALLAGLTQTTQPCDALRTMDDTALQRLLQNAAKVAAETCRRRGADIPSRL